MRRIPGLVLLDGTLSAEDLAEQVVAEARL
jgi:hypothetical protein